MKRPFNKKRFWLIIAILVVIEAIGLCLAMRWKYIFPSNEVSEIYKHYQNVQGIDVSFIKDFRVNDSIFIDVTMLEAKDSAGWEMLKHDFSVPELNAELQTYIDNGKDLIFSSKLSSGHCPTGLSTDTSLFELFATSYYSHTLTVFHAMKEQENHMVYIHNFDESLK